MAPSSTANRRPWNGSCGCWPVWLKDWASAPPRGSLRSMPTRCSSGWWKRRSSCAPFRVTSCATCTLSNCNSMNSMPCCGRSKPGSAGMTRRFSAWSVPPTGSGRPSTLRANCCWCSMFGTRTLEMAQRVVHQVVQVLARGCVPLCLTDGYRDYTMAFLAHWGYWVQPERKRERGPAPKPRWMPLPALLYAQVVKSYRRRRMVGVTYRVVFGTMERVQQILSVYGRKINTAFVERLNLDIRQRVAAVGRRVNTLCQGECHLTHKSACSDA